MLIIKNYKTMDPPYFSISDGKEVKILSSDMEQLIYIIEIFEKLGVEHKVENCE